MQRTIYIFERGILGWSSIFGGWKNWPNQASAWIHQHTPHRAQTLTYFCPAVLAAATRPYRARQFAKLIKIYSEAGWRIVMVCHSEGTATALRALRHAGWPHIAELHLVNGAADSDCDATGLNIALTRGRIGHVFVYVAGRDRALRLEDSYPGSVCFGLQTWGQPLGLKGPTNLWPSVAHLVTVTRWAEYGHSTCWNPKHFAATMRLFYPHSYS